MQDGDISNVEEPRLYFVCEGLVLLPIKERRGTARQLRNSFVVNPIVVKRIWDLMYRVGYRCMIVTFEEEARWVDAVRDWFDEVGIPAPLVAYSRERFMDEVVPLPACARVFDPDPRNTLRYGAKSCVVDPAYDFEPLL